MAWTTPRTWVTGEVVTAAIMNTHIRDNQEFLKAVGSLQHLSSTNATGNLTLGTTIADIPGASRTYVTQLANARYVAIGMFRFNIVTAASSSMAMLGHLSDTENGTLGPQARWVDTQNTTLFNNVIGQVWTQTIITPASITWKLRGSKSVATGSHRIEGTDDTRLMLAVFE